MNYSVIKYNDIANGIGIRTTLFVSGCRNHCKGCFQPETWNFDYGKKFDIEAENDILNSMNKYIAGITILGGDPMEYENASELIFFIKRFKKQFPDKTVWIYTGYLFEDLIKVPLFIDFFKNVDILVDGPFIEELKDISLKFKGSSNQRIIDIKKSIKENEVILYNI